MKVHFGGSGKGSEELYENYVQIRDTIRDLRHSIARDWLEPIVVKTTPSIEDAYQETIKAINKSDAVILEATFDTSSVGKQLSAALQQGLPVLLLSFRTLNKQSSIDKFVDKSSAKLIKRSAYDLDNLEQVLEDFFIWADDKTKLVRFNLEIERPLDNYLKEKAQKVNSSKAEEIRKLIVEDMEKAKGI